MTDRELMQQALDAFSGLLTFNPTAEEYQMGREAVAALRDRLSPQERPWVGLTDEDLVDCESEEDVRFVRAIEAKLKEKNT